MDHHEETGLTHNPCLSSLIVALNETCDGTSWYTSTKELQRASLEFCIACRNYPIMHLKVDPQIPRNLLAAADAPPPHPKRLCWTRVPRLRARSVTWNMRAAAELGNPIFAITDVDCLEFGGTFDGSLEAVTWPRRLKMIEFLYTSPFNQPLELIKWPESLQHLVLGGDFNHSINDVEWPPSLHELGFGYSFNQPIDRTGLPPPLQKISFAK
ncbi:conserved unknown protein [Ectocarpus siliculosus]|uniref:Uncharacterized protein n=1 Tax=Ectocarpus siliculosus TaxID=2880 RepID=D7FH81_ECTSI|nr:conserved unknown protein [Ectocarpus siliculosus]|eukprot:CBJ28452.1 conserved unknown protein [Ectocarpus siliculosus]